MKTRIALIFGFGLILAYANGYAIQQAPIRQTHYALPNMTKAPSQKEWQFFLQSPEEFKERLWNSSSKRNANDKMKAWVWQWRLAWLRACRKSTSRWCTEVESQGVNDSALVVRNEAVQCIFAKKDSYQEKDLLRLIEKAYLNAGNFRNKKPLYISYRILFGLFQLNSPEAHKLLRRLSKSSPATKTYAGKLTAIKTL